MSVAVVADPFEVDRLASSNLELVPCSVLDHWVELTRVAIDFLVHLVVRFSE